MKQLRLLRTTIFTFFAMVIVMAGCATGRVNAQNGQAFSISPPLIELKGDPGQTVTASIKLTNISTTELLMKAQFNDFGAKNETGEPNIIFDDTQATNYSLRHWIGAPSPFLIAGQQTKTIDFPITIPADAEPGGHYAVIRFTGTAPELEQNGVALTASIGSLVLLQVSGTVDEEASVAEFFTATPQFAKTGFFETGPVTFVERLKNDGNVHVKPTGTINIFNTFGQKVHSMRVNSDPSDQTNPPKSVLPNSIRRFDQTWDNGFAFGRYRATIELNYGQNSHPLFASTTFWVIPYKTVLIGLASLIALFLLARWAIKKI